MWAPVRPGTPAHHPHPLLGPEQPVPRIAQPRHDVALLVQLLVQRPGVDRQVRVRLAEGRHPLGRGDPQM